MKNVQEYWTIDYLTSLSDSELERMGRRVAGNLTVGKLYTGRVILAMQRSGLPARRGFSGPLHYFVAQGVAYVEARECQRVAGALEALPQLAAAAERGAIGWTYLREVVRVATAETEAQWLDLCGRHTSRQIQALVKRTRAGDNPLEPGWEPPEPVETELRIVLDALGNEVFARVTRQLSERLRRPLSPKDVVECLMANYLTGHPFPGERSWHRLAEEARRDLAARRESEAREVAQMRAAARDKTRASAKDVSSYFRGGSGGKLARVFCGGGWEKLARVF